MANKKKGGAQADGYGKPTWPEEPASFAPYNFIPFSAGSVPLRYKRKSEDGADSYFLPKFNESSSQCEEDELYTGWINYDMRVLTDIAVGDETGKVYGAGRSKDKERKFCRNRDGNLIIPGSTMRGFVRRNAEILSFSYPEFIDDVKYLFRNMVGENNNKTPKGDNAGWIYLRDGKYYIRPVKTVGGKTYFEISEKDLVSAILDRARIRANGNMNDREIEEKLQNYIADHFPELKLMYHYMSKWTKNESILQKKQNDKYLPYRMKTPFYFKQNGKSIKFCDENENGAHQAILVNSSMIDAKKHHYIVYFQETGEDIEIPLTDSNNYTLDFKKNFNKLFQKEQKDWNKEEQAKYEFYSLPDEEGWEHRKIFFYSMKDDKIAGFGPALYFRRPYKNSVKTGIRTRELSADEIDYASAMFGFIGEEKNKTGHPFSYKSRLSFQDAVLYENIPDSQMASRSLVLMTPYGTAYAMYLDQTYWKGSRRQYKIINMVTYDNEGFELRGCKFYWKRSKALVTENENESIASKFQVLPAENERHECNHVFEGKIRFENLHADELGLLLMSLRFSSTKDQNVYESYMIGSGKPYGYGKIHFENIRLFTLDDNARYSEIVPKAKEMTEKMDEFREKYINSIDKLLNASESQDEIKFEENPSIQIYRDYVLNANMDRYLSSYPAVYMCISKKDYKKCKEKKPDNYPKKVIYSDSKPLPMAYDILKKYDGSETEENNDMISGTINHLSSTWEKKHDKFFAEADGYGNRIMCRVTDPSMIDKIQAGKKIFLKINPDYDEEHKAYRADEWKLSEY